MKALNKIQEQHVDVVITLCNKFLISRESRFPKEVSDDVAKVYGPFSSKTSRGIQKVEATQGSQLIKFEYQNCYMDIADSYLETFTEQQKKIFHCFYSRNYDGYVHQKLLKSDFQ